MKDEVFCWSCASPLETRMFDVHLEVKPCSNCVEQIVLENVEEVKNIFEDAVWHLRDFKPKCEV